MIGDYQCFEKHIASSGLPENGGSMLLQNICTLLPDSEDHSLNLYCYEKLKLF